MIFHISLLFSSQYVRLLYVYTYFSIFLFLYFLIIVTIELYFLVPCELSTLNFYFQIIIISLLQLIFLFVSLLQSSSPLLPVLRLPCRRLLTKMQVRQSYMRFLSVLFHCHFLFVRFIPSKSLFPLNFVIISFT